MASLAHYLTPPAEVAALGPAVTGAGWSSGQHRERTARRPEYMGVLVAEGTGELARGGSAAVALGPGCFFWLPPGVPHSYGPARDAAHWTEHWVLFGGPATAGYEALGMLSGGPPVVRLPEPEAALTLMRRLVELAAGASRLARDLEAAAVLQRLIAVVGTAGTRGSRRDEAGAAALEELTRAVGGQVSMAALAERLGISREVLAQQVRRLTGSTPTDFLLRERLTRAKELLTATDLPIARVAQDVGYQDPAYFSRLFSRRVGCPPTVFRAQNHQ